MAKRLDDKTKLTHIYSFPARCGCGRPAEYEVHSDSQPHCRSCMLEAVDCSVFTPVRRIGGYYDDAS